MVYAERTEKCISPQDKESSSNKSVSNQSNVKPSSYSSSTSSSGSSSTKWSDKGSSAEKWKYNDMVRDNRDKFNSLHFS